MLAKLTAYNGDIYKAAVFNTKTLQYQFLTLNQCPFSEYAEAALKRQIPDVRIAHDEAEFAQWLTKFVEESEGETMKNNNNKVSPEKLEKIIEAAIESGKEPAQIASEHMEKFTWHDGDLVPVQKETKKAKKDEEK